MYELFTDRARKVMKLANQEAQRFNHEYIGTEHILLGLVREGSGVAANVLKNLDVSLRKVRKEVEKIVQAGPDMVTMGKLPHTPRAKKVIEYAIEEARSLNHNYIGTEHLLLGLLREQEGVAAQVLLNLGLKLVTVRNEVLNLLGHRTEVQSPPVESKPHAAKRRNTPASDSFTITLNDLAAQGAFRQVIGREECFGQIFDFLCRRQRRRSVIVGGIGAGKTALLHGLAQRIVKQECPAQLRRFRVREINLNAVLLNAAGTGTVVERICAICEEAERDKKTILVIDDLQTIVEPLPVAEAVAAVQTLLRELADSPSLRCIAVFAKSMSQSQHATNLEQSLVRYFDPVLLAPAVPTESLEILRGVRRRVEDFHKVRIADAALESAIANAGRAIADAVLPGSAIRLLDHAGMMVARNHPEAEPPDFKELDEQIESLNQQKEEAVANGDFEFAAKLRDQAERSKKQKAEIASAWNESRRESWALVDEAAIVSAAESLMPG